ncbi:hypothetical protein HYDPIDRAFT_116013 [Hydnomerulius pinastri MD-312]|uniref:Uncharacterized protein n=1 Tax=Hydnomerulius pinastri MD-312 TaxID=994086 RepID=A0A0C9V6P0_9AGAM|nr:hypothetical protein HYDPIDRAFT_116013 [Hydnomerulius pinastri MD-312]
MQEFDQGQGWSGSSSSPNAPQGQQGGYYPTYASQPGQQGSGAYAQPQQGQQSPQRQPTGQAYPARTSSPSWSGGQPRTNTYAFASAPLASPVSGPAAPAPSNMSSSSSAFAAPSGPPKSSSATFVGSSGPPAPSLSAEGQRGDEAPKSYYDPNARGYDLYGGGDGEDEDPFNPPGAFSTSPSNTNTASNAIGPSANAKDTTPTPMPPPTSAGSSTYVPPASWNTRASSPPVSSVQRPPSTGSGSPGGVDFSKLGLLPKRPISLVRPQSPPGRAASSSPPFSATAHPMARAHSGSEDDDELEYVENPFEERG